jgi:hypothetical protein
MSIILAQQRQKLWRKNRATRFDGSVSALAMNQKNTRTIQVLF